MDAARRTGDHEQLAERMAKLEDRAFEEFACAFGPRIRSYFLRRGLAPSDAEDLAVSCTTDIALKVAEGFSPRGVGSFEHYVFTLAYRAFVDWLRTRPPTETRSSDYWEKQAHGPEANPDPSVARATQEALSQLSETDQKIVALRDLGQGVTYAEIAEALGITAGAARVRHHRALKRLETVLSDHPAIQPLVARNERSRSSVRRQECPGETEVP